MGSKPARLTSRASAGADNGFSRSSSSQASRLMVIGVGNETSSRPCLRSEQKISQVYKKGEAGM
uniref:Uncharacterized protein n=1 Tax=Oryza meridionalis TaxID=40149 RepID=A0A0E0DW01_9ORYZ